jgi:hypothetical protein
VLVLGAAAILRQIGKMQRTVVILVKIVTNKDDSGKEQP